MSHAARHSVSMAEIETMTTAKTWCVVRLDDRQIIRHSDLSSAVYSHPLRRVHSDVTESDWNDAVWFLTNWLIDGQAVVHHSRHRRTASGWPCLPTGVSSSKTKPCQFGSVQLRHSVRNLKMSSKRHKMNWTHRCSEDGAWGCTSTPNSPRNMQICAVA